MACPGDPPPDAATIDADGDGIASEATGGRDCNDSDANINPNASEVCGDDIDNNCDGVVDDDGPNATTFFRDEDRDGVGGAEMLRVCEPPSAL